jgi:hypothetical protein
MCKKVKLSLQEAVEAHRHYDAGLDVADSIPDEVIGFFNRSNPSSRTVALGSTQPLNRNEYQGSSWG